MKAHLNYDTMTLSSYPPTPTSTPAPAPARSFEDTSQYLGILLRYSSFVFQIRHIIHSKGT